MGIEDIQHLNGIPWHDAPVPPRRHTCWVQSTGFVNLDKVERCACGATNMKRHRREPDLWIERNSRTRPEPEPTRKRRWWFRRR